MVKPQNSGEERYLRKGLDIAMELLSDEDLQEWNRKMEEE